MQNNYRQKAQRAPGHVRDMGACWPSPPLLPKIRHLGQKLLSQMPHGFFDYLNSSDHGILPQRVLLRILASTFCARSERM
jgi:hypothetical protein